MRSQAIILLMTLPLLTVAQLGCETEAKARRKYDGWFPPATPRQNILAEYGQPLWTVPRPAEHPTDQQWLAAVNAVGPWLHPGWFIDRIHATEQRTGQPIVRLDSFSPPKHWTWSERLDFLWGGHLDLVYYDEKEQVISSEQMPSWVWSD